MRTLAITFAVAVLLSDPAFAADQDAIASRIEQAGGKVVRQSIRKLGDGIVAVKLPARKPVDELLESLVGCPELRQLDFFHCDIGDDGWAALARLTGKRCDFLSLTRSRATPSQGAMNRKERLGPVRE